MYRVARDFYSWLDQEQVKTIPTSIERRSGHGIAMAELFIPKNFNGHTVLAVHGTGNDRVFGLTKIFQHLLRNGFALFTFDVDGHGAQSSSLLAPNEIVTCVVDAYEILLKQLQRNKLPLAISGLGHSLGGILLGSAYSTYRLPFEALSFLSVPHSVKIDLQVMLSELGSLGSGNFWQLIKKYGFREGLPAIGSFRRQTFPVRLVKPNSDYVSEILNIINRLGSSMDPSSFTCPSQWIFGKLDRIAALQPWREKLEGNKLVEITLLPKANHFTALLTDKAGQYIVRFFLDVIESK